jgi:hypothetical protein
MSAYSHIPVLPLLALYGLTAAAALFITRPSTGMRAVVLTLVIGIAMLAGISLTVSAIIDKISYEASWSYYQ